MINWQFSNKDNESVVVDTDDDGIDIEIEVRYFIYFFSIWNNFNFQTRTEGETPARTWRPWWRYWWETIREWQYYWSCKGKMFWKQNETFFFFFFKIKTVRFLCRIVIQKKHNLIQWMILIWMKWTLFLVWFFVFFSLIFLCVFFKKTNLICFYF